MHKHFRILSIYWFLAKYMDPKPRISQIISKINSFYNIDLHDLIEQQEEEDESVEFTEFEINEFIETCKRKKVFF